MKKIFTIILIIIVFSCGPFVDEVRITGTWKLEDVEFYEYNQSLDSIKVYKGIGESVPDKDHPIEGEFFCSSDGDYKIDFSRDNNLKITCQHDNTTDVLVDYTDSSWSIDTFDNSLYFEIDDNNSAHGFWRRGFELKNYWPLSNYDTLEILIKAEDVGKSYFKIDLTDDTIKIHSMKGIFKKS
jgi:hypothetical protein